MCCNCSRPVLARLRHPPMSATRPLSGVMRTSASGRSGSSPKREPRPNRRRAGSRAPSLEICHWIRAPCWKTSGGARGSWPLGTIAADRRDPLRQRLRKRWPASSTKSNTKHGQIKPMTAAVAAVLGKAKVLNICVERHQVVADFSTAQSMQDIGRKLLQSIGFKEPDDVSIQAAVKANDAFVERLEAIRNEAQGLTIDQDD